MLFNSISKENSVSRHYSISELIRLLLSELTKSWFCLKADKSACFILLGIWLNLTGLVPNKIHQLLIQTVCNLVGLASMVRSDKSVDFKLAITCMFLVICFQIYYDCVL